MQPITLGKAAWVNHEAGAGREWLVTNGAGSYAMSTIINLNTRKYHGLLVASLSPPVRRTLLLAKLDESVTIGSTTYNLATNRTVHGLSEGGYVHQQRFVLDFFPTFVYAFDRVWLEKTIFMLHGENSTVVLYRFRNGPQPARLYLRPMVNCRDHHWTLRQGQIALTARPVPRGVSIQVTPAVPPLFLCCDRASFHPADDWYRELYYPEEAARGEPAVEDHYLPGHFAVEIAPDEDAWITFLATTTACREVDGPAALEKEKKRYQALLEQAGYSDPLARRLVWAADAFIVRRQSTGGKSVIAGYPWFNDWGRDTMIALPGLTLVTRRFPAARSILLTYAAYCKEGLLPNVFPDGRGQEPLYNTVDAALWYFHAVYKYYQYTGDRELIRNRLLPVLQEIVEWYIKGTHFHIGMQEDGLLAAGSPRHQLTWMDAKVDQWVVTPRHGRAVEICALWYNALGVLEYFCRQCGRSFPWPDLPRRVKESFQRTFWYEAGGYLYDVVNEQGADAAIRPNQVIACALPFTPLREEQMRRLLGVVWRELYATYGLRSLAPGHPAYRGVYQGDRWQRDGAYHQGTAWSWLIGPFVTALRRAHNYDAASRQLAARIIQPFADHLAEHGVGYIAEIFDGNEPVIARGCPAQAWGVAEVLRAYVEDVLEK